MRRMMSIPIPKLLAAFLILAPAAVWSQQTEPSSVHWAYSAYFGSGWYSVTGDRDVFVVRMTPRWELSDATLDADGNRAVGIYLKTPISVGLNNFEYDDPLGAVGVDNVSFLSVNPGVDVEVPINEVWSLRPYASVGYGHALGSSESAWTYWAGVKSRLAFRSGELNWRILNQVGFVGYTPNDGPSDGFWPVMAGLEFDYPVGSADDKNQQMLLHWYTAYTAFENDLDFTGDEIVNQNITDQWELGVALGRRDAPISIWFLKFDRLGLAYRASSDGELKGITFVFRSMFEI